MKQFKDYNGPVPEDVYNQIKCGAYGGKITDFPPEVVLRMCECQMDHFGYIDLHLFERKPDAGFAWDIPIEGVLFWSNIILNRDFESFFKRYPKNTYPKVMIVSDYPAFRRSHRRVVFMEKNNEFLAWGSGETFEEVERVSLVDTWAYAKDIEPVKEVTLKEIAEKFGVHQIRIVE